MSQRPSKEQQSEMLEEFLRQPAYGAGDDDVEVESPQSSWDDLPDAEYQRVIRERRCNKGDL